MSQFLGKQAPGISFSLKEHPDRSFHFETDRIEHQNRYLADGLDGLRVRVTCRPPGESDSPDYCEVSSLTWLNAAPNMQALTGVITESVATASVALGSSRGTPAKFKGIVFQLRGHPGKKFNFPADSFEYQGRQLAGDLKGVPVAIRAYCYKPGEGETESYCEVSSLKWLAAQPAATKPAPPQK